jgi:hypothetical protein
MWIEVPIALPCTDRIAHDPPVVVVVPPELPEELDPALDPPEEPDEVEVELEPPEPEPAAADPDP